MSHYIVILPVYGSPFIYNDEPINVKQSKKLLNKAVEGEADQFENDEFHKMVIHPGFCERDKRWDIARRLTLRHDVKIFVHENGTNECCANVACLYIHRDMFGTSGYWTRDEMLKKPWIRRDAPFFGNIALLVPAKTLIKIVKPDALKMVDYSDWEALAEKCNCDNDECEADCDIVKNRFKERGWDYTPGDNQVYKNVIV